MADRELIVVRIDRAKWWRGDDGKGSLLWLRGRDCGCCLGHVGLALGAKLAHMVGCGDPADALNACSWSGLIKAGHKSELITTAVCNKMIRANDSPYLSDSDRESKLIKLARQAGYALEFYGTGNPAKEASNV